MPGFSRRSQDRLLECHVDLQFLFNRIVKDVDCSVLCGHRGESEQNELFESGRSQLKYPRSYHNKYPSMAVDVVPYPIDWDDLIRFHEFAGFVKATAINHGIEIEWGGDWTSFKDCPHWQLNLNFY